MIPAAVWILTGLLILATAIARSSLLVLGERMRLPAQLQGALRFAPACALAAIVAPELLLSPQAEIAAWPDQAQLWAGVAAALVMRWTNNILATIGAGMVLFWVLGALI